jgi:hypothetical protein
VALGQPVPTGDYSLYLGINDMSTSSYQLIYLDGNQLQNGGSNAIIVRVKFNYNFGGINSTPGTTRAVYANSNTKGFNDTCGSGNAWGINADTIVVNEFTGNRVIVNNLSFTAKLFPGDSIYFYTYNDDNEDSINNWGSGIGSMIGFMQIEIIY